MAVDKKKTTLLDDLEKYLSKMLKEVEKSTDASLTDKMKVVDRVLKLEQIKQKMDIDGEDAGFSED